MRRILPVTLAIFVFVPAICAEETTNSTPMPTVSTATPANMPPTTDSNTADSNPINGSFIATMSGNGNVRYGPSRQAKVAITMKPGQTVEVLGPARGAPHWLLVRLPRDASVWMHSKVLTPQADGKTFIVNEDRAKARDDATLGGTIVAEVAKGEIVESKGRRVGDWFAVFVPSATAYVAKTVLMPNPHLAALPAPAAVNRARAQQVWESAQKRYAAYLAAKDKDLEIAAVLDWDYLAQQLTDVVEHHPDPQAQAAALRMKDGIAKMVRAVAKVQAEHHITPKRDVPGQPPIPEPAEVVAQAPVKPPVINQTPAAPAPTPVPTPVPNPAPAGSDLKTAAAEIVAVAPPPPTALYPAVGSVMEQAFPTLGVNHVIVDENSNIIAFLKPKAGSTVQMNEYFWRYVGVKGEKQNVDPSLHKLGKEIPLIEVEDLVLLKQ